MLSFMPPPFNLRLSQLALKMAARGYIHNLHTCAQVGFPRDSRRSLNAMTSTGYPNEPILVMRPLFPLRQHSQPPRHPLPLRSD
jgi:hypothetical protein